MVFKQADRTNATVFANFIDWITSTTTLSSYARFLNVSRVTLSRRFTWCWLVQVPHNVDPNRIYDQVFIDGTYFRDRSCLLVASTTDHVIDWLWCNGESQATYSKLLSNIAPPLVACTDGHGGALAAIKATWPTTRVQRCLVHVKRNIQTHVGLRPTTSAGKALRGLSLSLLKVTDLDAAAKWMTDLVAFKAVYKDYLNEKTHRDELIGPETTPHHVKASQQWGYTHYRARRVYKLLEKLAKKKHLFTWLEVQDKALTCLHSTTNSLEGGINAHVKHLAACHRGQPREHQRTLIDWWLYLKTQLPDDPAKIARQQQWGKEALAKVTLLLESEAVARNEYDNGRPATYDTGIEPTPTNSMGIRKGTVGR